MSFFTSDQREFGQVVSQCFHQRDGAMFASLFFARDPGNTGTQPGSCVLVARNSSKVGSNAATVHLSPWLALPASQLTDAHVPGQRGNQGLQKNSFDNKSGALPGTTYTRNTPLTLANPTGSTARDLVSSVSSLPKRKVMAFASWIRCVFRPHFRASIRSHFSRVPCPIKKREHPVSITSLPL